MNAEIPTANNVIRVGVTGFLCRAKSIFLINVQVNCLLNS